MLIGIGTSATRFARLMVMRTEGFASSARRRIEVIVLLKAISALVLLWSVPNLCFALVVLQYHHVSVDTPAATSISPDRFAQHMNWLDEHQYKILPMQVLLKLLRDGAELPDKAAVITFDDGYTSIYSTAWPILREKKWPFTVFINSQHHDEKNRQYMSWEQLRDLAKAGVTIGNHSVSHAHLIRLLPEETNAQWRKRVKQEVEQAQLRIDKELGQQPKIFAYPFGEYDKAIAKMLKTMDYIAFAQHSGPIAALDELQVLPRFPFGGAYGDMKDFALKASSLPMPVTRAVLLDEKNKPLEDPLVADKVESATLLLEGTPDLLKNISCFYSGEPAPSEVHNGKLYVSTPKPIPAGRSRFNCTAPEGDRYRWLSAMLIKKNADGSWYSE